MKVPPINPAASMTYILCRESAREELTKKNTRKTVKVWECAESEAFKGGAVDVWILTLDSDGQTSFTSAVARIKGDKEEYLDPKGLTKTRPQRIGAKAWKYADEYQRRALESVLTVTAKQSFLFVPCSSDASSYRERMQSISDRRTEIHKELSNSKHAKRKTILSKLERLDNEAKELATGCV